MRCVSVGPLCFPPVCYRHTNTRETYNLTLPTRQQLHTRVFAEAELILNHSWSSGVCSSQIWEQLAGAKDSVMEPHTIKHRKLDPSSSRPSDSWMMGVWSVCGWLLWLCAQFFNMLSHFCHHKRRGPPKTSSEILSPHCIEEALQYEPLYLSHVHL